MSTNAPTAAPRASATTEAIGAHVIAPPNTRHERRWVALGVILIAQMMLLLDATIVNVALPSAQADLGFSDATRQWVVTAYLLAFGSLLPLGGRLADAFGRKTMFIVGVLGFAVASAAGGAAPNIGTLITARAVQGGFAAILAPAALSLITVIFTDLKELNKAFAIFGAVAGSAEAIGLFLTYYFQGVLRYSPIKTGFAFLPMMVAVAVVATLTQGVLVRHLSIRVIVAAGLVISGAGAGLLTQAGAGSPYAAWVLPGLILAGTGIGSAIVSAVAIGQQGVEPRDAGTAGAVNNVSQQLGPALGVAFISTFVATATNHYLTHHASTAVVNATVHGFTVGYWWAAGAFWAGAVVCGALIRGGTRFHQEAGQPEPVDEIISGLF